MAICLGIYPIFRQTHLDQIVRSPSRRIAKWWWPGKKCTYNLSCFSLNDGTPDSSILGISIINHPAIGIRGCAESETQATSTPDMTRSCPPRGAQTNRNGKLWKFIDQIICHSMYQVIYQCINSTLMHTLYSAAGTARSTFWKARCRSERADFRPPKHQHYQHLKVVCIYMHI